MTLKVLICLCMLKIYQSEAGVVSIPSSDDHEHHYYEHVHDHEHVPVATSYMHFNGPVEGPAFEVKVPYVIPQHYEHHHEDHEDHEHHHEDHEHHHHHHQDSNDLAGHHHHVEEGFLGYTTDYVAHPKYEFAYGVKDHHTGDFHGQKEVRDGTSVSGEYSVKEPGGSVRVVKYKADKDGFHAQVETKGKNDHSGATYSAHAHTYEPAAHHEDNQKQHHFQLQADEGHYQYTHDAYA